MGAGGGAVTCAPVSADRVRSSRLYAEQERALTHYVRREVYPYSAYYRRVFDSSGLGAKSVRTTADLSRVPLTTLEGAAANVGATVLTADAGRASKEGDRFLRLRLLRARVSGEPAVRAVIDPLFKPVHWTSDGDLRVAWTAADQERLAELGRLWLEHAGLRPSDLLASMLAAEDHLAFWQLQLGARRGGVATAVLGRLPRPAVLRSWNPTVLAGRPDDLCRTLEQAAAEGLDLPGVRVVLAVGEVLDDSGRARLSALASEVAGREPPHVVAAWSPGGPRALWTECPGGQGFHTWPLSEVVEVVDGRLVWSAVGWRGTALLRLATGVPARIDDTPCTACGRTTARVHPDLPLRGV